MSLNCLSITKYEVRIPLLHSLIPFLQMKYSEWKPNAVKFHLDEEAFEDFNFFATNTGDVGSDFIELILKFLPDRDIGDLLSMKESMKIVSFILNSHTDMVGREDGKLPFLLEGADGIPALLSQLVYFGTRELGEDIVKEIIQWESVEAEDEEAE
jgi:hypothetical protein